MPRPKKDPNAPAVAKNEQEALAKGDISVDDIPVDQEFSQELQKRIDLANVLIEQKRGILAELQEVRQACTILGKTGSGNREQIAWIRFYLPRKKRKEGADMSLVTGGEGDE
jgi:hypothetical protein